MDELAPGFRFYPTDEELISFYLMHKLERIREVEFARVIPVLNIYEFDPHQLPHNAGTLCHGDPEQWFFFVPRQEREARGGRPNRITNSGYWKATGSPGRVYSKDDKVIGVKKTMVFYQGKAPTGRKTKWKMTEYKAIDEHASSFNTSNPMLRHEFSVCRVYVNSGSLRAFDRRPSAPTSIDKGQGNVASTSNYHSLDILDATGSPDIACLGNEGHTCKNDGENEWEVDDPSWDWELELQNDDGTDLGMAGSLGGTEQFNSRNEQQP